ncbi:MAG: DUF309 domain-containing protein, partial [Candidatus Marinimicrobia bacterium]|nr:DUF309 domain-containing protein [Candidatus Neomarinimicrobiota bacterium]
KFRKGVKFLRKGELLKAHTAWEDIWKKGRGRNREWVRGFIQLTGALLKLKANQPGSANYLIRKAVNNLAHDEEDEHLVSSVTIDYLTSLKTAMESETLSNSPEMEAKEMARYLLSDSVLGIGK